jgi:4-diphosphocytidyl-2-C-methyl-D-erythritol kinase
MKITPTPDGLKIDCPAKVNLFLEILGQREDGYHEVETVMQTVTLWDTLTISPHPTDLILECEGECDVPAAENLVVKAGEALRRASGRLGARLALTKRIPLGAGLGGGSSDAAGALIGLNQLWNLRLPPEQLASLGDGLGADVPFFLHGGTALCRGRGEQIEPLPTPTAPAYVLLLPPVVVSTARVYQKLDEIGLTGPRREGRVFHHLLESGEPAGLAGELFNRLRRASYALFPILEEWEERLRGDSVLGLTLSGSGSALLGLCADETGAQRTARRLRREFSVRVEVVRPWVGQMRHQPKRKDNRGCCDGNHGDPDEVGHPSVR